MMEQLKFNIDTKKLKGMGYTFQKLYARNYKTYSKKVGCYKVWIWVKDKSIEVTQFQYNDKNIIAFYEANANSPLFNEISVVFKEPKNYIVVLSNGETGEVKLKDYSKKALELLQEDHLWSEIILHKEDMDMLLQEIKMLQSK